MRSHGKSGVKCSPQAGTLQVVPAAPSPVHACRLALQTCCFHSGLMLRQYFHTMFFMHNSRSSSEACGHKPHQGTWTAWLPSLRGQQACAHCQALACATPIQSGQPLAIPSYFKTTGPPQPSRGSLPSGDPADCSSGHVIIGPPPLSALKVPMSAERAHRPHAGQVVAWARKCPGQFGAAAAAG